jgi:hypothetical protein
VRRNVTAGFKELLNGCPILQRYRINSMTHRQRNGNSQVGWKLSNPQRLHSDPRQHPFGERKT